MSAHDAQTGNVAVRHAIRRLLFHLCEDVADNSWVVIRAFAGPRDVDSDIAELRPGECVVQVVFQKVILREILEVGVLDEWQVGAGDGADVHGGRGERRRRSLTEALRERREGNARSRGPLGGEWLLGMVVRFEALVRIDFLVITYPGQFT